MSVKGIEDIYPLSPAQASTLSSCGEGAGAADCYGQLVCRLRGALDADAFGRAWQAVAAGEPILRTSFVWRRVEQPIQVVHKQPALSVETRDWRALPAAERAEQLRLLLGSERERGFDPAKAPLLRPVVCREDEDAYTLVCSYHRLIADEAALGLLLGEVFREYAALAGGREARAESGRRPFGDYVAWLQQQNTSEAEGFWAETLKGVALPTPTGLVERAAQASDAPGEPGRARLKLSDELAEGLLSLTRKQGLSPAVPVQGAWALLLYGYGGESEVVFGVKTSGRPEGLDGAEKIIGPLANTLPVRARLRRSAPVLELLEDLERQHRGLGAYAYVPAARIRELNGVPPEVPLFSTVLSFGGELPDASSWDAGGGLEASDVRAYGGPHAPLRLDALTGARPELSIAYDPRRFDAGAVGRMLEHLRHVLESIVSNPAQPIGGVSYPGADEREEALATFADTASEYPRDACVHELFEAQAAGTPEAVAVVFGDRQLTYRELNGRANQLARYLKRLGVGPETLVGLCLERSPEMIVGMLAVLKAGGAYVPLDPDYPLPRLLFMLSDTQTPVLLTEERLLDKLPAHWGQVVCLDSDWEAVAAEGRENLDGGAAPENLAYVMYTSGSTGQPKGTGVVHRGVVRLVRGTNYVELTPDEVLLQLAPHTFDASTFEIWGALLNGARLVLMPAAAPSLEEIGRALAEHGVTTLWLTAGLFNLMVDERLSDLKGLRQLLAGGDVLSPPHVKKLLRGLPRCRLINGYGPTENTTFTCCHPMKGDAEIKGSVPIGRPVSNTRVYVLNKNLEPVPEGVAGELFVGGDGLARCYLNRPGLTAEKFVPDPFDRAGGRLYRTGDLVGRTADGNLEFLGRADQQIKVRGFRIEPGEIESALGGVAGVRESVVVTRDDERGDKYLVAYVVAEQGRRPTAGDLRQGLRERLPEHMIPAAFVVLDELPLTANGKVDRRALPAPDYDRPDSEPARASALTPTEEILLGLWSELLGREAGVNDDFFELGGHSLLATQLVSRVRHGFNVELPLRALFESPTVTSFARRVEEAVRAEAGLDAPPIVPVPREGPLPLSYAQQRLWFIDQLQPGNPFYNIAAAVRLSGELNAAALEATFNEIVRRHEALRTGFVTVEGEPRQSVSPTSALEWQRWSVEEQPEGEREASVMRLAAEEARKPFDLSAAPLLRAGLVRVAEREHVLLLTMHHIVSDGWSIRVLIREVTALYEAYVKGEGSPLPELEVQYADYAVWQREWLQGEVLERQLSYWRGQLAGAPPVLELPTDRARPAVQSFRGATLSLGLGAELSEALKAVSRKAGVTVYMTLLAAFQSLLARYSGQDDIVVGTPIANRNRAETEALIGFFVNTLVLRARLGGDPTFAGLLGRVREAALGAYAHQDVPFERLVEELQPERSLSHTPLFQIMFSFQEAPEAASIELPGLKLSSVAIESDISKFDLAVTLHEVESGIEAAWQYNTDLFDEATIARMGEHYRRLLGGLCADPARRVSTLSLLSDEEREQLLAGWNDTRVSFPAWRSVHEQVSEAARVDEAAAAVAFGAEVLSYGELERRASQVARHLARRGAGVEQRVGVLMERGVEMVVSLLGVLKAGAAYVPLDPQYPQERLSYMLRDSGVSLLLTQKRLAERLEGEGPQAIRVDADWAEIAAESAESWNRPVEAQNLAYVIYTSGSTGRAKGVMIQHGSLGNLVAWHRSVYGVTPADRATQLAGPAFDASVWELWPYLTAGASIHVPEEETRADPARLARWLAEQAVTICFLPTPLAEAALPEPWPEDVPLRAMLTGGDKLRRAPERPLPFALVNHYGPTENTVVATCAAVAAQEAGQKAPPIGRPIANTRVYLLDERLEPVPPRAVGELHIGGAGLARGYLDRPALTAEKFIPDPFAAEPGGRLYKTGDLARYTAGGELEFLGRIDQQVKIRGFRIEPGEIESALKGHPSVRDAVVVAGEDASGERRLFGYVVVNEGAAAPPPAELAEFLQKQLPDYMIPAGFMVLDALPLTPSGKVDRRALPSPEQIRPDLQHQFVAPRTPIEEMLAEIWRKMLNLEQVGVNDNFFELGGHSLLATQLVSRMRETFNVELPLKVFFEGAPTIARLAAAVEETQLQQSNEEAIAAMLMEMDDLSDEEIKALLKEESMLPQGEQGE